ncbi:MAG: glycosyltransferase family 1 protein [Chloroflexi bacterium]|nr:glycosyltransferase family 1 protein [Chloroflexota bacterium]
MTFATTRAACSSASRSNSGGDVRLDYDVVCLSHLRWDFVYQRPHHLVSRFARLTRVFFVEEPIPLEEGELKPRLDLSPRERGPIVVVPRLPSGVSAAESDEMQARLLTNLFDSANVREHVRWYYTPMALGITGSLPAPLATVYDCMDQLSAFRDAPPALLLREHQLFRRADLVFTGGQSLYEAKRFRHHSVHLFPSSVEVDHFSTARQPQPDPDDQAAISHPRIGFFGVLDERLDTELLAAAADLRPTWQFVLLGPIAKIEPTCLPRRPNLHYLGPKAYADLPRYLAGWDVASIPFARNEATRYISPTKTPEYLAAGCPVVSTSIRDVVEPYGGLGLARIADTPSEFVAAVEASIAEDRSALWARADDFLASTGWDSTWSAMVALLERVVRSRSDGVRAPALQRTGTASA